MASRKEKPAAHKQIVERLNKQLVASYATNVKQLKTNNELRATIFTLTKQIEAAKKPWWRVWWK